MKTQTRRFEVIARCPNTKARVGRLHTPHGTIDTPVFAPVGTQGSVKTLLSQDLEKLGTQLILGNTYHLYLRPGVDVIRKAGGLHKFMSWNGAILTDSGGYQVFSMEQLRRISEEGVEFRSHIDGSLHFLSPEKATEIQLSLGSDIVMCFDECPPYPCTEEHARKALEITTRWAKRCKVAFEKEQNLLLPPKVGEGWDEGKGRALTPALSQLEAGRGGLLYGITQGAIYPALRKESTQQLLDLDFPGYALGGLSLGEPPAATLEMVALSTEFLPEDKPRYLMGVGTPEDLWEAVGMGIDQFDCVLPTRNGRNGQLFTSVGKLNIKNAPYREDQAPPDPACDCDCCSRYSRSYLHHLFRAGELSALRLASLHNVAFLIKLMRKIRQSISAGTFAAEKRKFIEAYRQGDSVL
jgi:queuine tRNA-ribosyltransferase